MTRLVSVLVVCSFALVACSGTTDTSAPSTAAPPTAGTAPAPTLDGGDCASEPPVRPTTRRYASTAGVPPRLQSVDIYGIDPPEGCGPRPALLWVHGGGWRLGDKAGRGIRQKATLAAEHGWVLVGVNYRLSSPGAGVQWPDHGEDVAAATAWVLDHAGEIGVDPQRLALMGHSAGGHLVSIVTTDPALLEAVGHDRTDVGCVVALDTEGYDLEAKAEGGDNPRSEAVLANAFGTDPADRIAASPTQQLADHHGPVASFLVVTRGSSRRQAIASDFAAAVRATGSRVDVVRADGYSHAGVNLAVGDPADDEVAPAVAAFLQDCLETGLNALPHLDHSDGSVRFPLHPRSHPSRLARGGGQTRRAQISGEGMTITTEEPTPMAAEMLPIGTKVEVRRRFDQHWARGFEVAAHRGEDYELRRMSDGELLPVEFSPDSLRKERKKSTWWY